MADVNAASCSYNDVNTAVGTAVAGDRVIIPACAQTNWTTQLTANKCIIIKGTDSGGTPWTVNKTLDGNNLPQSVAWAASHTIIGDNVTKDGSSTSHAIAIDCSSSANEWGLNTIEIVGVATDAGGFNKGHVQVTGTSTKLRLHHIKFSAMKTGGILGSGCLDGVIDHVEFNGDHTQGVVWFGQGTCNGGTNGDGPWATATSLGSTTNIVIEDVVYNDPNGSGAGVMDHVQGSRVVLRQSVFSFAVGHGTETGGRQRGIRQFEIYDNTITNFVLNGNTANGIYIRGGTGVIYNNAYKTSGTGSFTSLTAFDNQRSKDAFQPWGQTSVSSLTRSGSTATAAVKNHGIGVGFSIAVSGAVQTEYNGTFTVVSVPDVDTLTYTVSGTPATPATGTILVAGIQGASDGSSPWDTNNAAVVTGTHNGTDGVSNVLTDTTKNFTTACSGGSCQGNEFSVRNITKRWGSTVASVTTTTVTNSGSGYSQGRVWNSGDSYEIRKASPAMDQVGRGAGIVLSGAIPSPASAVNEASEPVYLWNNTLNGTPSTNHGSTSLQVISGRDFLPDTAKPGYTPLAYPYCVSGLGPGCGGGAGCIASLSVAGYNFQNLRPANSASAFITLTNTGDTSCTISSISINATTPAIFTQTNNCAGTLGVSASCTITITFVPNTSGAMAQHTLTVDVATGTDGTCTLDGTGLTIPTTGRPGIMWT